MFVICVKKKKKLTYIFLICRKKKNQQRYLQQKSSKHGLEFCILLKLLANCDYNWNFKIEENKQEIRYLFHTDSSYWVEVKITTNDLMIFLNMYV